MRAALFSVMVRRIVSVLGVSMLLLLWMAGKYFFEISDRYLPSPSAVMFAVSDVKPSIVVHAMATGFRVLGGTALGAVAGILVAILTYVSPVAHRLLFPSVQALRSVPPVATVPFFLLWFGFSEAGKQLLVVSGSTCLPRWKLI